MDKPVPQRGDVWRIGYLRASDARVLEVHDDRLVAEPVHKIAPGVILETAQFVKCRRLVERDGKAVE